MPAEWETQEAIWLSWPHNKEDWPGKFVTIPWVYAEIIRYISRKQRVRLIVKNTKQQVQATATLASVKANLNNIDFFIIPTNRVWLRDSAPTFVYQGKQRILLDWKFNAWAKYDNWLHDSKISKKIAEHLKLPIIQPTTTFNGKKIRIVLEGGAIDVNGKGSLIATEECLLSKTQLRNPGFTRTDYERIFAEYLGISQVIWLKKGIAGDDTHGHIDDLARFVNQDTIVTMSEKNKQDINYTSLKENLKILQKARDQNGKLFNIIKLPMPKPVFFAGQRLPASYANFLLTNDWILVPVFNDPNDRVALNTISALFPRHNTVGIYCGDFVLGLGTIHCASQQEISPKNHIKMLLC